MDLYDHTGIINMKRSWIPMKKLLSLILAVLMMLSFASALADETIEFWTVFTGDDGATLQGLIDRFNAENEGISVNHTAIAAGDLYTKLPLAVQTGEGIPDLLICHVERLPKLVGDGVLTDVEFLLENGVDRDNYPAEVLERTNIDGYQYGIPWDFNAGVTYVNLDLLAKYGMEKVIEDRYITFDEIKEVGAAVAAAGDAETVKINNFYGSLNGYLPRYEELGGQLIDAEGNLTIDPAIWGKMIEGFRELVAAGYAIGQQDDAITMFTGGKLVFYEAGTWTNATLQQIEGLNYTALAMPCYTAETALCRSGSHTWMQPENEERTEETDIAVATFVDWMGANSLAWAVSAGQVPLYKSVTETEEFKALPQTFLAEAFMSDHIHVYTYYYWALLDSAIDHAGKDAIYDNTIDAAGVGAQIQAQVDDAINASL